MYETRLTEIIFVFKAQKVTGGEENIVNRFIICELASNQVKVKVKVLPITGYEGPEGEWRYSSTLS